MENIEFYERFFDTQPTQSYTKPDPNDFKVHCSGIQSIMATPKAPNLIPVGAQTVVEDWFKGAWYGKKRLNTGTVATLKGTAVEWDVVQFIAQHHNEYYKKNDKTYQDEFMIGTPDIVPEELTRSNYIIDIKSPEDCFSFPLFDELPPVYYWQMQGYLHLTKRDYARVIYALVTPPDHIIEKKAKQIARDLNETYSQQLFDIVKKNMSYDEIPPEMRIKEFRVDYNPADCEKIVQRVKDCRTWLSQLLNK